MSRIWQRGSGDVSTEGLNMLKAMRFVILVLVATVGTGPLSARAVPRQIIILRHGEKADSYALCSVGVERSLALAQNYLGKGSSNSLLANGESPAGIFSITLHTLELVTPASQTWAQPVIDYSVVPPKQSETALNTQTRRAAHDILTDPRFDGKVVVLVWEHKHIANEKLEKQSSDPVTLRQLLHLDVFGTRVPRTWSGDNYDYFWIVDFGNRGSDIPTKFRALKQVFAPPFQDVPSNDWGTPENLPPNSGCLSKA
jgi:hypothetical protein